MLRLPSKSLRRLATRAKVPLTLPIGSAKDRTPKASGSSGDGYPPRSPQGSHGCGSGTVHRKSFVLEHSGSVDLEEVYDVTPGQLGAGGFGTVRRAALRGASSVVRAVKSVKKSNAKAESLVRREIAILRHLDHPCVCRLLETFEDRHHIYLVMELIDGRELFDEIVDRRYLDERQASHIMSQVFSALQYCHEQRVIHRDLKPENIMVQRSSCEDSVEVKLIDFGLAVMCENDYASGATGSAVLGTNEYLAPEARKGKCSYASDVWGAGMVLHALLVGSLPARDVCAGVAPLQLADQESWGAVSLEAKELLRGLLQVEPKRRLTAATAACHAWTTGRVATANFCQEHVSRTMEAFASFHQSVKLRRAALTALAMQMTTHQLRGMREQFQAIDTDGNGRISKEELVASMAKASPCKRADEEVSAWAEHIFDSIDTDGSRSIDYTEWCAAALQEGACRCDQALRAAFRTFDADGDGKIDEGEFARVLMQTPQEVASLLPQFDTNGDGVIDFEEFKSLLTTGRSCGTLGASPSSRSEAAAPPRPSSFQMASGRVQPDRTQTFYV